MLCQDALQVMKIVLFSVSKPRWLEIIVESYLQDPQAKQLLSQLSITSPDTQGFSLHDGVIKLHDRIWVGNHTGAKQAILLALHSSGVGGHSGFNATYHKVKSLFSWPKLKEDVKFYVAHCTVCQQEKPDMYPHPDCYNHCRFLQKLGMWSAWTL